MCCSLKFCLRSRLSAAWRDFRALQTFRSEVSDVNSREVMELLLITQYFDTLKVCPHVYCIAGAPHHLRRCPNVWAVGIREMPLPYVLCVLCSCRGCIALVVAEVSGLGG
jgi:hypothetical protein